MGIFFCDIPDSSERVSRALGAQRARVRTPSARRRPPAAALPVLAALLLLPRPGAGQVAYASEPGFFVVGSPLAYPYLGSDRSAWWAGAGLRLAGGTDVAVRVGRGEDTPYGNPLPVTYVDHTVVEARTGRLVTGTSPDDGVLLALAVLGTVEDRSGPVSDPGAERVRFREGPRLSEYGGRAEVHRVWRWGSPGDFNVHPRIGLLSQYRKLRGNTVRHEPEGVEGVNEGVGDFTFGLGVGLGLSVPLGGRRRLVVEPRAEGELRSDFLSAFDASLAVGLNF